MSTPEEGRELSLEWFVARRYLSGGRGGGFMSLITLIAVGGVAVGVMALIVVIGVMTGLQNDLQRKILGATPHGRVLEIGREVRMNDWRSVLEEVGSDPAVTGAAPFVYTEVGLNAGSASYSEGAVLRGLPQDSAGLSVGRLGEQLVAGQLPSRDTASDGRPGLVVGRRLADRLGLYPGETVAVISVQNTELTPTGLMPQMARFRVTGVFETGLYQYDTKFTFAELSEVQQFLGLGDAVTGVEFNVEDPWRAGEVGRRLQEDLGHRYEIDDWQQQNASLFEALKLEKLAMAVILLLIVLVAAFNIVSTLIMMVTDKTREIGILRSMGITEGGIRRIFVLQGTVIGIVGTTIGAAMGGAVAWALDRYQFVDLPGDVYFVDHLPVELAPFDLGLILGASVLISFLATLYPSSRAADLTPVEAIRHE
ncbi:MAG: FtsX-like permease family protein [Gemmatimonadota bacterium]